MNQQQRNFACRRIEQIFSEKVAEAKEKHTTKGKQLTKADKAKLVRNGSVKLNRDIKELDGYDTVRNIFDFSRFETRKQLNTEKFNAAKQALEKQRDKAMDEVMLGDPDKAKTLITNFENAKV